MKKYENLFQMGQVTSICGITRRMLINYENLGLIEPTVVDKQSGYRYFDILSFTKIQLILDLRKTGLSLCEIGKYLNGECSLDVQIKKLIEQKEQINLSVKDLMRRNVSQSDYKIELSTMPKKHCICRQLIANDIEEAEKEFVKLYGECIERGLEFDRNSFHFSEFQKNIYDEDFFEIENIHMRICICINENCITKDTVTFEETNVAKTSYVGPIEEIYHAYDALNKYLIENNYQVTGFPREQYIEGNFSEGGKFITEIAVPIKPHGYKSVNTPL